MDVIIKVISFSLIALFVYLILNENKGTLALMVLLITGILIFLFLIPYVREIIDFMRTITDKVGMELTYVSIVMKIIAISYLATFCSVLCKDAGVNVIASKIEFAGKIMILILALPIMMSVLDSILKIM